jgi:predicted TIM-barrel fold metal-dependent hydrolase
MATREGMMPPIVDVHTHLFSALDIPLEGYLLSRKSENRVGRLLDPILSVFPMPLLFRYVASRARERCVTRRLGEDKRGWFYTWLLTLYSSLAFQRFLVWENSISSNPETNAGELIETWPEVDLFVPLVIDYEYWFANSMDHRLSDQIETVYRRVVIPHQGRIHPFVPFDPARELAYRKGRISPDGQLETDRPMAMVKEAIENQGFIGVKLYNSLGYRPLGNADPTVTLMRNRIAVRNNKMTYRFDGEEYDEVLCDLYDFCIDNEVPITAHCVMNGIEAYPNASFDFGQAKFWDEVLTQNRYRDLRLNLAHFGWNDCLGQGYGGDQSWARDVCDLIVMHRNVYADVSHHRLTTALGRRNFVAGYRQMLIDYGAEIEKIKSRILYGSDWHVLKRLPRYGSYRERYEGVLKRAEFFSDAEMGKFRGANAIEFLGFNAEGENRRRLGRFYERNRMTPPPWFSAA